MYEPSSQNDFFVPKPVLQVHFICDNFQTAASMNYFGCSNSRRQDGKMFIGSDGGNSTNDMEITCAGLVARHCMLSFDNRSQCYCITPLDGLVFYRINGQTKLQYKQYVLFDDIRVLIKVDRESSTLEL